ncbi:CsbD family protein [Mycobacterium vicinigordonae]|uniref:CsbD family protein n=2 Tax=Mycobacterium vicinigordonae TaxID=1719132 RepID=A0A7D6HUU0_9MYCO|nr:CsbD family protein [Mycobacterium vicinigordonae]
MAGNRFSNTAQYWGGRAKETIGRLTGNRRTEFEGRVDQVKANAKDAGNRVARSLRRRPRRF